MAEGNFVDLGMVTDMTVMKKPGARETFILQGDAEAGRWVRAMTRGAAQTLWFHLTHILFPDKANQITQQVSTALLRPADAPSITSWIEVIHDKDKGIVLLNGAGGSEVWSIQFTPEVGHGLWVSLERTLFNR